MLIIINNTQAHYYLEKKMADSPGLRPDGFLEDREIVNRLAARLGPGVKCLQSTNFSDLVDLLRKEPTQETIVFSNLPAAGPEIPVEAAGIVSWANVFEEFPVAVSDSYSYTCSIFKWLSKTFPHVLFHIITGSYHDPQDLWVSLGCCERIAVQKKEGPNWDESLLEARYSYIDKTLRSLLSAKACVEAKPKPHTVDKGDATICPRYWYSPGERFLFTGDAETVGIYNDGVQDLGAVRVTHLDDKSFEDLHQRFFQFENIGHSTFRVRPAVIPKRRCPYCRSQMRRLLNTYWINDMRSNNSSSAFCISCGWWTMRCESRTHMEMSPIVFRNPIIQTSEMHYFDLSDIGVPIEALADAVNLDSRSLTHLHPRRLEEIVAHVFSNYFGFEVSLTKMTRDGGYDILAIDSEGGQFLVEVKLKRDPRGKIGVSVVRQLCGAMVGNAVKHGMIVTNATFTTDSMAEASLISQHGWEIELKDIDDLCSWLGLVRQSNSPHRGVSQADVERQVLDFQMLHGIMRSKTGFGNVYGPRALNQRLFILD